jgi:hypothetical protein
MGRVQSREEGRTVVRPSSLCRDLSERDAAKHYNELGIQRMIGKFVIFSIRCRVPLCGVVFWE